MPVKPKGKAKAAAAASRKRQPARAAARRRPAKPTGLGGLLGKLNPLSETNPLQKLGGGGYDLYAQLLGALGHGPEARRPRPYAPMVQPAGAAGFEQVAPPAQPTGALPPEYPLNKGAGVGNVYQDYYSRVRDIMNENP
jgi:hypothetical protein